MLLCRVRKKMFFFYLGLIATVWITDNVEAFIIGPQSRCHSVGGSSFVLNQRWAINNDDTFTPSSRKRKRTTLNGTDSNIDSFLYNKLHTRRIFTAVSLGVPTIIISNANKASATDSKSSSMKKKCTDVDSCREIGERKIEEDQKENPTIKLPYGVRYKILQAGVGDGQVTDTSKVDLIYSISKAGGAYMYSKGFGFEKIDIGDGQLRPDNGLDSLKITLGKHNVPVGVEQALVGMKRGERRRVNVPSSVGFDTSNWQPEPTTRRGKAQIAQYQRILEGFGSQPPFPASTIWDVEILSIF